MTAALYRLDEHNIALPCTAQEWAALFMTGQRQQRRVSKTIFPAIAVVVSTVFLGVDYSFGQGGPPLLFETRVFGIRRNGKDIYQVRTSTWAEAEDAHQTAVLFVTANLPNLQEEPATDARSHI